MKVCNTQDEKSLIAETNKQPHINIEEQCLWTWSSRELRETNLK